MLSPKTILHTNIIQYVQYTKLYSILFKSPYLFRFVNVLYKQEMIQYFLSCVADIKSVILRCYFKLQTHLCYSDYAIAHSRRLHFLKLLLRSDFVPSTSLCLYCIFAIDGLEKTMVKIDAA